MKKTFRTLLSSALVLALAACSYVPELPYPDPNDPNHGGGDTEDALPFTSASLKEGFNVQTIEGVAWSLGNSYAKASGYANETTTATKTWLVSPAINTTTDADTVIVKFDNVLRYVKASTDVKGFHKVLASTDYAGDVTTATWTDLGFEPVESATQSWTFYAGKPVVLPEQFVNKEKVYLAFYFECTAENSTTWELQNLYVGEGSASGEGGDKPVIEGEGDGTKANPYNVAAVQSGATGAAWVKGYIVGFIPGKAFAEAIFGCEGDTLVKSNIIIGATADASTTAEVIPVALPAGAVRNALAVAGNAALLGKEVAVHGNITSYFGTTGVKDVDDYVLEGKGAATPDTAVPSTVADFIAHQGDGNWYILTGAIQGLKDGDQYGNFDLVDETGSVYVYGVRSEYNGPKQKFQELVSQYGLKDGDVIKINAQSTLYTDTKTGATKNEATDAFFVELVSSSQGETVTEVTIDEFNSKEEGDDWYKISGTVSGLTAGDNRGIFTLTDKSGSVSVDGLAAAKGAANDQFQSLVSSKGIIDGCTLTIVGQHGDEDGVIINSYFVSITGGQEKQQPDGENLVSNGGFENWDGTTPVDWKSASTASNATLSQSTDAHSGSYSVSVGGDTSGKSNKRLACKEITLPAGKYAMSFYVKSAEGNTGSVCPGFVPVVGGKISSGSDYKYGSYANAIPSDSWTEVTHSFELTAETTLCLVIMNSKNSKCAVLVDDVTLVAAE